MNCERRRRLQGTEWDVNWQQIRISWRWWVAINALRLNTPWKGFFSEGPPRRRHYPSHSMGFSHQRSVCVISPLQDFAFVLRTNIQSVTSSSEIKLLLKIVIGTALYIFWFAYLRFPTVIHVFACLRPLATANTSFYCCARNYSTGKYVWDGVYTLHRNGRSYGGVVIIINVSGNAACRA